MTVERTGFEEVKEERCGLCVKASEEKILLEEMVKRAEAELREAKAELREAKAELREAKAELREAKAELRETKVEVVALREGRDDDDDGGGEEGIEDEVVVVPAASTPAEPRPRSSGKKRKAAEQVVEQPRNVKKVKTALPTKGGNRNGFNGAKFRELRELNPSKVIFWTEKKDAALIRGGVKHGTYWEKIHETESKVLGDRTVGAIGARCSKIR
ncbi:hypothetical protein TrLO_g2857 [Triparma laevis f. longispina]|uniref:Uncharacterized protein n=1 Tax=Triparma laevis f. longispina TaxID=1714387 RepID=A0A9W7CFV2_9STRA|nr:hypothetical protein TrLO_g2857 [Triparma laevis f. longispina]